MSSTREVAEQLTREAFGTPSNNPIHAVAGRTIAALTDAIDAALRQRELEVRAEAWQPIETAPKDGSAILIYDPGLLRELNGNCAVARWDCTEHSSIKWWVISDGKFGPYDLRGPSPTHWMPLPSPPTIRRDSEAQEREQR